MLERHIPLFNWLKQFLARPILRWTSHSELPTLTLTLKWHSSYPGPKVCSHLLPFSTPFWLQVRSLYRKTERWTDGEIDRKTQKCDYKNNHIKIQNNTISKRTQKLSETVKILPNSGEVRSKVDGSDTSAGIGDSSLVVAGFSWSEVSIVISRWTCAMLSLVSAVWTLCRHSLTRSTQRRKATISTEMTPRCSDDDRSSWTVQSINQSIKQTNKQWTKYINQVYQHQWPWTTLNPKHRGFQ